MLILNGDSPAELALGLDYGFKILRPKDIPNVKMNPKYHNVVTIGAAFYYAMEQMTSDYIIFLEKDFMADYTMGKEAFIKELLGGVTLLESGAWIIRLRSRTQQGCDSFKICGKGANWAATNGNARKKNHWSFYCDNFFTLPNAQNMIAQCIDEPKFRCHTSFDTNWSLNAVMVKRSVMLEDEPKGGRDKFPQKTLAAFGLSTYDAQDGFERLMIERDWGQYKVPVCISVGGVFYHAEVDG